MANAPSAPSPPTGWGRRPPGTADENENFDVGAAVVGRNEKGQTLAAAVGADRVATGLPPGQLFDVYGYPVEKPFNGGTLQVCREAAFEGHDFGSFFEPGPLDLAMSCDDSAGGSGGGWVIEGDVVNSVTTYGYPERPGDQLRPLLRQARWRTSTRGRSRSNEARAPRDARTRRCALRRLGASSAAALAAPARRGAGGRRDRVEPRFQLAASHGYRLLVAREGDGDDRGRRGDARRAPGSLTTYVARGVAGPNGIHADFDHSAGSRSASTRTAAAVRGLPPDCRRHTGGGDAPGDFTGTVGFEGEGGYTAVALAARPRRGRPAADRTVPAGRRRRQPAESKTRAPSCPRRRPG